MCIRDRHPSIGQQTRGMFVPRRVQAAGFAESSGLRIVQLRTGDQPSIASSGNQNGSIVQQGRRVTRTCTVQGARRLKSQGIGTENFCRSDCPLGTVIMVSAARQQHVAVSQQRSCLLYTSRCV